MKKILNQKCFETRSTFFVETDQKYWLAHNQNVHKFLIK